MASHQERSAQKVWLDPLYLIQNLPPDRESNGQYQPWRLKQGQMESFGPILTHSASSEKKIA